MSIDYLLATVSGDYLTTEDGRFILLDSFASTSSINYGLAVDWDDDGAFNGDNEAVYLKRFTIDRGRQRLLGASGSGFEPYRVGRAVFELDNSTGRFNPWNTDSALYGILMPGKRIKFEAATYGTTDSINSYGVFTGYLANFSFEGWNKTATLTCDDGFGIIDKRIVDLEAVNRSADGIGETADYIVNTLAGYPYDTSFSASDPSTDYYFPAIIWSDGESALSLLDKITAATLGSFGVDGDGTLRYYSVYDDDAAVATLTDSILLNNPYLPNPWEFKRDVIEYHSYFCNHYAGMAFYPLNVTYENSIGVEPGETVVKWISYRLRSTSEQLYGGFNCPNYNWTLTANSAADGTGSDVTTDMDFSVDAYLKTLKLTLTNNGASTAYATSLAIGTGLLTDEIDSYNSMVFTLSDMVYRYGSTSSDWNIRKFVARDNQFINEVFLYYGTTDQDRFSRLQEERIELIGKILESYLETSSEYPILQMEGRHSVQFSINTENKLTYNSSILNINKNFRVCGISHKAVGTPQKVVTTLYLYPVFPVPESI